MEFIPERLRLAMFLRRENMITLAKKAELSKQAISKFQNGHLKPSKGALLTLADSLQLPVSFFLCDIVEVMNLENEVYFNNYTIKCSTGESIAVRSKQ